MRRSTILLVVLTACLAFAAACSTARSDEAIATDIKAKMFSDPQLRNTDLQVAVNKGQVTLTGAVSSNAARYEAFKLATQTPGVSKVNDGMTVEVAQATPAPKPAPDPTPVPARRARSHAVKQVRPAEEKPAPAPAALPAPAPAPMAAPAPPPPPPPPPPPQPKTAEFPAGTTMTIRMIDGVDSSVNRAGEVFEASLDQPLVSEDHVVVPKGANIFVRLVNASSAGHMTGRSELRLEMVKLVYQGKSYPLVSSTYEQSGSSRGKRTAATVGGGAALGALIGAIAGGGKGAAIGAGVGAASGGVYQGATKGQQVRIPAETKLDFRLEQPLSITYMPKNQSATE
jgi:BON domain